MRDNTVVQTADLVGDFTINRLFTQKDETSEYNSEHRYFVEIHRGKRDKVIVELTAAEQVDGLELRKKIEEKSGCHTIRNRDGFH